MSLNGLDIAIIALLAFFILKGLFQGFIREIITIVGLALAFVTASIYYRQLAPFLEHQIPNDTTRTLGAFLIIFLAVYFLVMLIGFLLDRLFRMSLAKPLNILLGGLVGLVKGLFLASVLLIVLTVALGPDAPLLKQSKVRIYIQSYSGQLLNLFPKDLRQRLTPKKPFLPALPGVPQKPPAPAAPAASPDQSSRT